MDTTPPYDEAAVRRLLTGGEADVARAFALINRHLRGPCCTWLHRRFPYLPVQDLADIWAETLVALHRAAQRGSLPQKTSLKSRIWWLAEARAIDRVRHQAAQQRLIDGVGELARLRQSGRRWQLLDAIEGAEFSTLLADAIALLPERQQTVMQVYLAHCPESDRMAILRREVSKVTSAAETVARVERALDKALRKVRAFLRTKGYGLGMDGEP